MKYIQMNAETSVKTMLKELSLKWGLKEVDTVKAVDYMDDGSELHLAMTIDRNNGTAHFNFEVNFLVFNLIIGHRSRDVW
jgi:5-oxoprolinase (ATP-hydrolysing)